MVRVKVMLAWLLPTLGLAASEYYVLVPVSGSPVGCACALFSASKQGKRTPLPDVRSFAQSARLQNRRMGTQSGPSGLSAPVLGLELPLVAPGRVRLSGFSSEAALGLAKRWQFDLRTALEPRAPSSVS
jgi:hypothetical protein